MGVRVTHRGRLHKCADHRRNFIFIFFPRKNPKVPIAFLFENFRLNSEVGSILPFVSLGLSLGIYRSYEAARSP